jgi:hypothetical protein
MFACFHPEIQEVAAMAVKFTTMVSWHGRVLLVATAAALVFSMSGCSISTSISDSVSSPFKWSSDSSRSSSKDNEAAYQGDVRDYTEAYVRSSSDIEAFRKGLASLATKHGITNWEADQATYLGIGEGLGKAQVTDVQLEVYKTNLSGGDAVKASAIQNGYEKYRKEKQS